MQEQEELTGVAELDDLLFEVDQAAKAIKKRLIEKHKNGKKGWRKLSSKNLIYKAKKKLAEMSEGHLEGDIDVIGWMLIHWANRKL